MRRAVGVVTLIASVALVVIACGDDPNGLNGGGGGSSGSSGAGGDDTSSDAAAGSSGGGTTSSAAAKACVDAINAYRKQQGLPAYQEWTAIEACSDGEAKSDGSTNVAHGAFPACGESAQNECPGWAGPAVTGIGKCLELMWGQGRGEGHHDNMASKQWTKVACGFYTLPDGSFWSVQNFK